ncbi:alpha/beta hydrolase fold protein [Natronomonas pharaonis DSM 2160]|uniref:Alpha/beta hydrolase fold protein n=1 Tax=Natronomonas pharaonis (strain ATCC 35678 / DSM 2160 / CIP 103997 / JCM 8858 / NBRC 14720 / NCIMB 2260 / Gabara) TaxID=348780 RepID=A0A1U7EUC5_NATPD|nr:dienelactone hydrolase family protein [Natronomonas pharaonis]CAI48554.1 alpha/beta hydrolase fold protein [Natronomonas pharaonis DSM 2160]
MDTPQSDASAELPLVHVSRPGTVDSNAPAIVLIHGRGTNERDLLPLAAQLPDELHVLSVRAPQPMDGPDSYTWYDLDLSAGGLHASQPDPEGFRRSLDLVHDFVDAAIEAYDLDADRVGLLGFSQGAITSLSALLERPEAYRWIVALNGYLAEAHHDEVENADGTPVFVGCGNRDQVIPPERAQRAAELLGEGGAEVRFERYDVGHGTTPAAVTDVGGWLEGRY